MELRARKIGRGGVCVYLPKELGYIPGDKVEVLMKTNCSKISTSIDEEMIRKLAREEIEKHAAERGAK